MSLLIRSLAALLLTLSLPLSAAPMHSVWADLHTASVRAR